MCQNQVDLYTVLSQSFGVIVSGLSHELEVSESIPPNDEVINS